MSLRSDNPCGVVYADAGTDVYLPLEWTEVHADVVDVSGLVTITQHFWQYSPSRLSQAKYVFPVPSRAAVCGFEVVVADGAAITAVVKKREEAKREHQAAIRQGRMTGLVEHVTDDIFSISLGALPARQMVTTKITYVLDLMDDDSSDQVRLQLPMYIGMRYGHPPSGMVGAQRVPPHRIRISVDVRMQGAVKKVASPTHPSVVTGPSGLTHAAQTANYASPEFLTQDFVLVVTAEGLDAPRCFAQRAPNGTVAMQLSIVPKFNLPSVPQQEYIFLVDRSGSMRGERIETAKRALVMLLRSLPTQGTWFNIVSFGSYSDSLWRQSVAYDERSLTQATRYIDTMSAEYGGTEMRGALQQAFSLRKIDVPTSVFVLTDGEAYDIDQTIQPVEQAVGFAKTSAPVRVFTLGIGETTSSALCEGMARAGNGLCLMATTAETIIGKCSRLVRASRTYILKNVSVDWGVRNSLAQLAEAYRTGSTELKSLRQAPADISAIYPGNRFAVFALVEDSSFTPPSEIVIRAQRDGHGEVLQFSVPVQLVEFPPEHHPQPLIQTLAARRAIMDIEDSNWLPFTSGAKALVIRLGVQYQLASRYTSFVAVDKRTRGESAASYSEKPVEEEYSSYNPFRQTQSHWMSIPPSPPFGISSSPQVHMRAVRLGRGSARGSARGRAFGRGRGSGRGSGRESFSYCDTTSAALLAHPIELGMAKPSGPPPPTPGFIGSSRVPAPPSARTSHQLAHLPPPAPATPPPVPQPYSPAPAVTVPASDPDEYEIDIRPTKKSKRAAKHSVLDMADCEDDSGGNVPRETEARVMALIRLQSFDGSFPPNDQLVTLLGGSMSLEEAQALGVSEKVWATALAIACLRKHMKDQPELLEGLVEKATEFIAQTLGIDVGALFSRAEAFFSPV